MRSDLADGLAALQRDAVPHGLGRSPGRRRRLRPGHGRANADDRHHERRRGGGGRRRVRAHDPADRELADQCRSRSSSIRSTRTSRPGTYAGHLPLTSDTGVRACTRRVLQHRLRAHRQSRERRHVGHAPRLQLPGSTSGGTSRFSASTPTRPSRTGYDESGDWGILNCRFSYAPADGDWEFSVFGTNLTDEYMINSGFFHGIWGFDFATVASPARGWGFDHFAFLRLVKRVARNATRR